MVFKALLLAFVLAFAGVAAAGEAAPAAENPALEKRVNAVASELRCLVCQNQTIADSTAGLAIDLKNQIRERMERGESDRQIVDFMVQRYGDFVLYRPPIKATTLLLWFGPLLLVIVGLLTLYRRLKAQASTEDPELSPAERERAARLLAADSEGKQA
jgi:cytochrome c-type biogenesis protein CcmH